MRIGIANDLPIAVESLRVVLGLSGRHEVIWTARDGAEAVRMCAQDRPDLILMDLVMPVMDGVAATRRIMLETPCPILVVTASVGGNPAKVFEALGAGALDAVNTPVVGSTDKKEAPATLLFKIDTIAKLTGPVADDTQFFTARKCATRRAAPLDRLVAIGCSAGGPAALAAILGKLEPGFPAAIVVVQHLDEQFAGGLADWLNKKSTLPVRLAHEGDRPMKGAVLLAGTSDHLVFVSRDTLGYTPVPRECSYRPSVDVFFDSIVQRWEGEATGVLLTGMGRDGARGLRAMLDVGHCTLAQDRASSAVYGMPKAAAELDAAAEVLALDKIAARLSQQFAVKAGARVSP